MKRLFKQIWGRFRLLAQHLSFYVMLVTMVASVATMWVTALSPWLMDKGIDPELWMLLLAVVITFVVAITFEYKVTFPSFYSQWNEITWKSESPIKKTFEDQEERLNKRLDDLEKLIKESVKGKDVTS